MTVLNITRKELQTAADNDIDKIGNKIKLKSTSLTNTQNNIMNIPIISSEKVVEKEEKIETPDDGYVLDANIIDFVSIQEGGYKPINVKEKMLEGIKKHRQEEFGMEETTVEPVEEKNQEPSVDELSFDENIPMDQIIVPEHTEAPVVDIINNVETPVNLNIESSTPVAKEEKVEVAPQAFDINKEFDEITLTRKEVENIRQAANKATRDAEKSDEELRKSVDENNSIETQLKNAEVRSIEIEKELIEALKKQSTTLNANREKYNKIIVDSNSRREQNETKISELQNKTSIASDKLSKYQSDIDSKEQILKALLDLDNNLEEDEIVSKKIA